MAKLLSIILIALPLATFCQADMSALRADEKRMEERKRRRKRSQPTIGKVGDKVIAVSTRDVLSSHLGKY